MAKEIYSESEVVFKQKPTNPRFIDLSGQTINNIQVLGYFGIRSGKSTWYCRCECGNIFASRGCHINSGATKSCGCRKTGKATHGKSETPEYRSYSGAKSRCNNTSLPSYKNYGGRGIEFRFESFEQFYSELGPRPDGHSLDRIDNDSHYEPGNVRWATPSQQNNNTRATRMVTINGKTMPFVQWCGGVLTRKYNRSQRRTELGWCDVCAISTPVNGSVCPHK